MWKISRQARTVIIAVSASMALFDAASAQSVTNNNTQNFGFHLPTPPMPHGFDEVRAADGTTCRSSISNSGPYLDVGGIASDNRNSNYGDATVYGRVIIPLGKRPRRIDCRSLYQLEIERLKHELHLARSGGVRQQGNDNWQQTGWNNE